MPSEATIARFKAALEGRVKTGSRATGYFTDYPLGDPDTDFIGDAEGIITTARARKSLEWLAGRSDRLAAKPLKPYKTLDI